MVVDYLKYGSFAKVYDKMMDEVPYEEWMEYIEEIFARFKVKPEIVLELGCGTGNMTNLFAKKGYETIGIDLSEEMLAIAREKAAEENLEVLYSCQDMRDFELYGTVGCVVALCDSINYIIEEDDLLEVFRLVNIYLDPKGLFVFDMNTEHKFKNSMSDNIFAQALEDCAYIWENYYYEEEKINEYKITLFIEDNNSYKRSEELHYEKAYSIDTVVNLLKKAGMTVEGVYAEQSFLYPDEKTERIYFVARENGKQKKIKE